MHASLDVKRNESRSSKVAIILSMNSCQWPLTYQSLEREPDSIFHSRLNFDRLKSKDEKESSTVPQLELHDGEFDPTAVERIASYMQTGQRPAPLTIAEWTALHSAASYLQTTRLMASLLFASNSPIRTTSEDGTMKWYYEPADPDWSRPKTVSREGQILPDVFEAFAEIVQIPTRERVTEFEEFRDAYEQGRTIDLGARHEFGRGVDATNFVRQHLLAPVWGPNMDQSWRRSDVSLPIATICSRRIPSSKKKKEDLKQESARVKTPEEFCMAFHLSTWGLFDGFDFSSHHLCVAGGSVLKALIPSKLELACRSHLSADKWAKLIRSEMQQSIVHLLARVQWYDPHDNQSKVHEMELETVLSTEEKKGGLDAFGRFREDDQLGGRPLPKRTIRLPQPIAAPLPSPASKPDNPKTQEQIIDELLARITKLEAGQGKEDEKEEVEETIQQFENPFEDGTEEAIRYREECDEKLRDKGKSSEATIAVRVQIRRQLEFIHGLKWSPVRNPRIKLRLQADKDLPHKWMHSVLKCGLAGDIHNRAKNVQRDAEKGICDPFRKTDVDLFLCTRNADEAKGAIEAVYRHLRYVLADSVKIVIRRSMQAVTFLLPFPLPPIQIILRLYHSPEEVIVGFDLDCCAVALTRLPSMGAIVTWPRILSSNLSTNLDPSVESKTESKGDSKPLSVAKKTDSSNEMKDLILIATDRFRSSLVHRTNIVDATRASTTFEQRLLKYFVRGFDIGVPYIIPRIHFRSDWVTIPPKQMVGLVQLMLMICRSRGDFRGCVRSNELPSNAPISDYDEGVGTGSWSMASWKRRSRSGFSSFLLSENLEHVLTSNLSQDKTIFCAIPQKVSFLFENPGRQDRLPLLTGSFHPCVCAVVRCSSICG